MEKGINQKSNDELKMEKGYTRIHNRILEELAKTQLSGYETRLIMILWRKTYGWQQEKKYITQREFALETGLPKNEVSRTLSRLKQRNLVVENYINGYKMYGFNKHFTTWRKMEKSTSLPKNQTKTNNPKAKTPSTKGKTPEMWKSTSKRCKNLHQNDVKIYIENSRKSLQHKDFQRPKEIYKEKKENIYSVNKVNTIFSGATSSPTKSRVFCYPVNIDPETKTAVKHYASLYFKKFNTWPPARSQQIANVMKPIVKTHGLTQTLFSISIFMDLKDPQVVDAKYSIDLYAKYAAKIIANRKNKKNMSGPEAGGKDLNPPGPEKDLRR